MDHARLHASLNFKIFTAFLTGISIFLLSACSSVQKIPGQINMKNYCYKIPEGYQDITDEGVFVGISGIIDISEIMNHKDPKGIYNNDTGTAVIFDKIGNLTYSGFYPQIFYAVDKSNDTKSVTEIYDPYIPGYLKRMLHINASALTDTADYKMFEIEMEAAFIKVLQIICWSNNGKSGEDKNKIIAVGLCRPEYKKDTTEILISVIKGTAINY